MNTTSMSRTGRRRLNRALNRTAFRRQLRRLDSFAIHLAAGRRPPPVNWLRQANKTIAQYIRLRERSLKRWPEEHAVDAWARIQRERKREEWNREVQAAMDRVYGPGAG